MAEAVYALCTLTCLACAALLLRSWRKSGSRLLLWGGLCFVALTVNNALLFLDLVVFPGVDLRLVRNGTALLGAGLMLYGLIAEPR